MGGAVKSLKQPLTSIREKAFVVGCMLFPLWVVGQIARDSTWLTGMCFYIPSAFLATIFLGFGLIFTLSKQHRRALLAFTFSLPTLGFVLFVENQFIRFLPPASPNAVRLIHWNVGGKLGQNSAMRVLLDHKADVYVLSEIDGGQSVQTFTESLGEPYQAAVFGNMAVVGKGSVRPAGWILNRNRVRVQSVVWEYAGHSMTMFVVDLPSNILEPRAPTLKEIISLIKRDLPDLVIGDFNAPRRSLALSNLPPGYRHAYDAVGIGIGYTWPVPVPMYSLDQCILSSRITPIRYSLMWSVHSDHSRQEFSFTLP